MVCRTVFGRFRGSASAGLLWVISATASWMARLMVVVVVIGFCVVVCVISVSNVVEGLGLMRGASVDTGTLRCRLKFCGGTGCLLADGGGGRGRGLRAGLKGLFGGKGALGPPIRT